MGFEERGGGDDGDDGDGGGGGGNGGTNDEDDDDDDVDANVDEDNDEDDDDDGEEAVVDEDVGNDDVEDDGGEDAGDDEDRTGDGGLAALFALGKTSFFSVVGSAGHSVSVWALKSSLNLRHPRTRTRTSMTQYLMSSARLRKV